MPYGVVAEGRIGASGAYVGGTCEKVAHVVWLLLLDLPRSLPKHGL